MHWGQQSSKTPEDYNDGPRARSANNPPSHWRKASACHGIRGCDSWKGQSDSPRIEEARREHEQIPVRTLACPVHQPYLLIREQLPSQDPACQHLTANAGQFCIGLKSPHKPVLSKGVRWQTSFRFTPV